jgi:uncharacterized protein
VRALSRLLRPVPRRLFSAVGPAATDHPLSSRSSLACVVGPDPTVRVLRRSVALDTADGLRLVGDLALPADRPPAATLICFHPNPTAGGSMDAHLLREVSEQLPALAAVAVLRVNTRGTTSRAGTSEGAFDDGGAERYDVSAALDLAEHDDLPRLWLLGWSFGADLVLRHGDDPSVEGALLISPALRTSTPADLQRWASRGTPLVAVVPEHDEYLPPAAARERFAVVRQCEVVTIFGAGHLLVGHADEVIALLARRLSAPDHLGS